MEYSNEELIRKREHNQTLYKFYKMFSWDLLFYYAISFLFLHETKGLSTSQIIFADAFYPLFTIILQLPCTILVEKFGKKKSLILGNLSLSMYILIVILLNSTNMYIFSNIFYALAFVIKGICETNILFDSIENSDNKRKIFSKIESNGASLYYYLEAITSVTTGFLFVFNPFLPIIISLIFTIFSVFLTFNFEEIPNENNKPKHNSLKNEFQFYISDLKQSLIFIIQSNRLRALILFYSFFETLHYLYLTLRRSLLTELNVPNEYFGLLFALWGIVAGFSVKSSSKINKSFANHTLEFLGLTYTISLIVSGFISTLNFLPISLIYYVVFVMITIQFSIKGPFHTLIHRYLGSFSNSSMQTKISSANMLIEGIYCSIISFLVSFLTSKVNAIYSTLLLGILSTIILLIILKYMKTRVGLKPEEYPESDIKFN